MLVKFIGAPELSQATLVRQQQSNIRPVPWMISGDHLSWDACVNKSHTRAERSPVHSEESQQLVNHFISQSHSIDLNRQFVPEVEEGHRRIKIGIAIQILTPSGRR